LILSFLMILILVALASFSGCSSETTPAATKTAASGTPKNGGTLRYADPYFPAANIGWPLHTNWGGPTTCLFLEPLLRAMGDGSIQPWLATKWEVSSDRKSITLTLREGVKFHDGSDFNATVAKWNLDNMVNAKRADFANVTSVDIVNNNTIRVNIQAYTNSMLNAFSDRLAFMVSKKAYDDHGGGKAAEEWMALNPVGTGPFKLDNFKPGVSIKGVKFDGYWQKGLPHLDAIEVIGITDTMTRSQSFLAGEVDMIAGDLTKVEYDLQQQGFEVNKGYLAIACLVPDSANPNSPLSNVKVRQAIDYAIDRNEIAKLGYGFWPATGQFAVPGSSAYDASLETRKYDPAKAQSLLTEAGYPNGFKTQILGNAVTTNKDAMVAVQSYLSKVGITVEINMMDNAMYNEAIQKGWSGFAAASKSVNANMNSSINTNWSRNALSHPVLAKTDEFQALYEASATSPEYDPALVKKTTRYMYDNAMVIFLFAVSRGYVLQPYLHDLDLNNNANFMIWGTATAWMDK
jgi:ABC-type transport system substrate-binding protein